MNLALASKTDTRLNRALSWTYDPVGNVDGKTDYQDEVTEYQYDSTHRLVAMGNAGYLHVSYHFDGAGRLIDRILSNGAKTRYRYDDDDRLTQLTNTSADGIVVENLTYTRDRVGNITRVANSIGGKSTGYTYDALYRLKHVDSTFNADDRAYTYDKVGNRRSLARIGKIYVYCYHPSNCNIAPRGNRLYNIRTGSPTGAIYRRFEYDHSGRILRKRDGAGALYYTVTYNGKGRAKRINGIGFAYDPNDYRIKKQDSLYLLEGEHLEATYSTAGVLQNKYLRGVVVDEIVNGYAYHSSDANDWSNYTFHHDHLNSVTALTGHAGSTEETTSYDAFGGMLDQSFPGTENELLFTGRQWDEDNRLYYYRARYYDPEIGRFISEDPIGFGAGVNFYAYVGNNPVNFNDPSGKVAGKIVKHAADLSAIKLAAQQLNRLRKQAVSDAWRLEQRLINEGRQGSVPWTDAQAAELLQTGRVKGFEGHHVNNVNTFPELAGNPRNIQFVDGRLNHLDAHSGNFTNSTTGELIDRSASGALGPITLQSGRDIAGSATTEFLGFAAGVLGGIGAAAEYLDYIDPLTHIFNSPELGVGSDIFTSGASFNGSSGAGGGFVLYPNKPNTNLMQRVYQK